MKRLPKPSNETHLASSGYDLKKTQKQRRLSLDRASKKTGTLPVLKRLNLIRNLTKRGTINKKKLTKDVDYMKTKYGSVKRKRSKTSSKSKRTARTKKILKKGK